MSRPYADQKPFDRNGDGRLNAREWNQWYNSRCGIDNELNERENQPPASLGLAYFREER